MKRRTRLIMIFAGAVLLLTGLTGCGVEKDASGNVISGDGTPISVSSFYVKTVDGRNIPCVWAIQWHEGSLSCDWSQK